MKAKRVGIIIGIVLLILLLLAVCYFIYQNQKQVTLESIDHSFKITVPAKIDFKVKETDGEDYKLDLYSVKGKMFLNTTVVEKKQEIDLKEAVNKERVYLAQTNSEIKNISEAQEIEVKDYAAYQYTYEYYDKDLADNIYCKIVWIETQKNIYILDLEVIQENQKKYDLIFDQIISSFEETIS